MKYLFPKKRSAFTLIELLIVVAIIAILAAIAVPNFLEAQTRSKVSRTKADMRTMATALEAYYVDNNKYTPDFSDVLAGNPRFNTLINRLVPLTTPIAYLTSLPNDIFAEPVAGGNAFAPGPGGTQGAPLSPAPYQISGQVVRPIVYDYAKFDQAGGAVPADNPNIWAEISNSPESVAWALNSPGPDAKIHQYLGFSNLTIYDPTNGTISNGQIIRTNLGADDKPKNL